MQKKVLLSIVCSFISFVSAEPLLFEDFPLSKMDKIYQEQSGPVAQLVYQLIIETKKCLGANNSQMSYQPAVAELFKKLAVYKRFIAELEVEWSQKRNHVELENFFKKMFSRLQAKKYIEKLSQEEFYQLLNLLQLFLWDVAHNAPHARQKCYEKLTTQEREEYDLFLTTDLAENV